MTLQTALHIAGWLLIGASVIGSLYWAAYFVLNVVIDVFFRPKSNPIGSLCMLVLFSLPLDVYLYVYH